MEWIDILQKIEFPAEGIAPLLSAYETLKDTAEYRASLAEAERGEVGGTPGRMEDAARKYGVPSRVGLTAVLLPLFEKGLALYQSRHIPEAWFWDNLKDLSYKSRICRRLFGVYGTNWYWWHLSLLFAKRVKIGRLQYEWAEFPYENVTVDGFTFEKGKSYFTIHITEQGPLLPEDVEQSMEMAADFYGYGDVMPLTADTWLFYPPLLGTCFAEGSNIYRFARRFTVIETKQQTQWEDAWRIFDCPDGITDPDSLPEDTALRRSFKQYIRNGGTFGESFGVMVWKRK